MKNKKNIGKGMFAIAVFLVLTSSGVLGQYAEQSHPWDEVFCVLGGCLDENDLADSCVDSSKLGTNINTIDIKDYSIGPSLLESGFQIESRHIKDRSIKDEDLDLGSTSILRGCEIKSANSYEVSCDPGK